MTSAARERARIRTPLLCASACAWAVMWLVPGSASFHAGHAGHGQHEMAAPGQHALHGHAHHSEPLVDAGFVADGFVLGWVIMLVAMMLPLMSAPIRHVVDRSLAARRARSVALFLAGYGVLWLGAGVVLAAVSQRVQGSAQPLALAALAASAVLVWQVSPWKQVCLNRLHAHPALAAFGTRANWGALRFGVAHGFWCAGSCWGLMLLPLLISSGHMPVMLAASLWMWGEQLERASAPSWRWRAPLKAVRLVLAQAGQRRLELRPATGQAASR